MPSVKIGIQLKSLRQPLRQALTTAARLGAAGIEIDARTELLPSQVSQTGLRELRKLLSDRQLQVSAVAFPTRRGFDVADDLERRVLATQVAMRLAGDLRADVVVIRPGNIPSERRSADFSRLIESLSAMGSYGERIGVRLALQTTDASPEDLLSVIKAVPEHSAGIDMHPTGLIRRGHSPQEAIELLGPFVLHAHACDAVRDLALCSAMEVELGRGAAEFPELLGRLTEFDYHGWVTIERRESTNPIADIENAVEFLRSL